MPAPRYVSSHVTVRRLFSLLLTLFPLGTILGVFYFFFFISPPVALLQLITARRMSAGCETIVPENLCDNPGAAKRIAYSEQYIVGH